MNRYLLRDSKGVIVGDILRTLKNIPLYEIHFKVAEDDIEWPRDRRVAFTETMLFVYMWGGKDAALNFQKWAEEVDANGANC